MFRLKVCGMRDKENIKALVDLKPDYIGFIFYDKSPRFVGEDFRQEISALVPEYIKKAGVFVNAETTYVTGKIEKYGLDLVQLHGRESAEYCKNLSKTGIRIIKAFSIDETFDFLLLEEYDKYCEFYLFDTKVPTYGGSGKKFDWKILEKYNYHKPFLLSGGIGIDDMDDLKMLKKIKMITLDINSRFEKSPGFKDIELIETFIKKLNQI